MASEKYEKNLILGGGPAGMACAMELHKAGKKCIIIEKDEKIGGLAKTLQFKEGKLIFRTDIGPHRFFSKNKYLYDFIEELIKEKWLLVNRKTRQYIDRKFYDYPINAMQAFKNIGPIRAFLMGLSYLNAVIKYRILKKKIRSFEDYITANFGRRLGEFNMLNYTEKIWGLSCKRIHPDWATQRIKGLNLRTALMKAIFNKKKGPKTLVDQFYYPQYGTGLIYDTIADKITAGGSKIRTRSQPTKIKVFGSRVKEVELSINGRKKLIEPETIVTSIPITELLRIISPKPPEKVIRAARRLKWRNQVYLFITLNKNQITDDNWIYFPNKEIPFGRVSEMKNFSKDMSPKKKTSLFIEFFVTEGDKTWNMTKKEIYELAMGYIEKIGLFSKKDVRNYYLLRRRHVYPVYDLNYVKNLKIIKEYLDRFRNLIYIGRPGRFQYTNQDHSLEMGILAARSIIEGKRYDFDSIGSEKEYFEKGYLKK